MALVAFAPLTITTATVAWVTRVHYSALWWTAVLLIGTTSAGAAIWLLATRRTHVAEIAFLVAALTLPSGLAFGLNIALVILSLPLLILG